MEAIEEATGQPLVLSFFLSQKMRSLFTATWKYRRSLHATLKANCNRKSARILLLLLLLLLLRLLLRLLLLLLAGSCRLGMGLGVGLEFRDAAGPQELKGTKHYMPKHECLSVTSRSKMQHSGMQRKMCSVAICVAKKPGCNRQSRNLATRCSVAASVDRLMLSFSASPAMQRMLCSSAQWSSSRRNLPFCSFLAQQVCASASGKLQVFVRFSAT